MAAKTYNRYLLICLFLLNDQGYKSIVNNLNVDKIFKCTRTILEAKYEEKITLKKM